MAKWIEFSEVPTGRKTKTWLVRPLQGRPHDEIGVIQWYGAWRKYCFFPHPVTVYEQDCLRDIAEFCETASRNHRAAKVGDLEGANQ